MPKPNDDILELKRRLLLVDRLDGRVLVCAEGPYLTGPIEITDADALVAACRAGRPAWSDVRAGISGGASATLVTPAFLAAARRDLRVLESPRVASIVRSAGRIFRRHGDLDAPWIAEKQAHIDAVAAAARRAAFVDQGGGAFPPWMERALEIVALARGDEAADQARSLALEITAEITQGAAAKKGARRPSPQKTARGPGPRDDIERALTFLAHASLWFDPRPRDSHAPLTPQDLAIEIPQLRAIALRYKALPLRLDEALALSRLKLGGNELAIAKLVSQGLPVEKVRRMAKLDREAELVSVASGAEGASAYAEWVLTLVPHYNKLGLDLPFTPELFDRMAASRKSDLAVLAVCLLKHHSRAEPDTAEQALARLDATLALFSQRPADVASILGELTGTTPGAGRKAMPEIAEWLGDDALLDRYVHLSRIAGQPISLSRTLRADFDRRQTLSRERAHLASLPSRTPVQEARLARLHDAQVVLPSPDRTRRRLADRIPELLARAYESRLDAALRRIAREAWGIQVPRLTPGWRDAIRFYLAVDDNRELLGTVLRTSSSGADLARALPRNQAWIASVSSRFDVEAWLAPRSRDVDIGGQRHRLEIERDPVEVLRMGIPFDTCLSIEGGCNAASTVVNAADANKRVLYLRDPKGGIVARKLLAVSRDHTLIGYHLYVAKTERQAEIAAAFQEMCERISEETRLPLAKSGKPKQIHPGFWYDDGPVSFQAPKEAEDLGPVDVTAYCRSLGVPVPEGANDTLRREAWIFELVRAGRADEVAAAIRGARRSLTMLAAGAWLAGELDRERQIEEARRSWQFAGELLGAAAKEGYPTLLRLAAAIAGNEGGAFFSERVRSFPFTLDLGKDLLEAAWIAGRAGRKIDHNGVEHQTIDLLPDIARALPVAQGFTLCDRAAPFLQWFAKRLPECAECVGHTEIMLAKALARAHLVSPDPAAVLARLGSRGSALSRRIAVTLAARFPLAAPDSPAPERFHARLRPCPPAARALLRLARKGSDLASDPDLFAAILRQSAGVPRGGKMPVPATPPFEALRDLVARLDLTPLLAPWTGADVDLSSWRPDPWELYHHRRADTPLRARLVREAARLAAPPAAEGPELEEALHRLARLGDLAVFKRFLPGPTAAGTAARRRRALLERASAIAGEIAGQMRSAAAEDPLSAEAERRERGRPKTNTEEHDRGLSLAALARIDRHLAEGGGPDAEPDDSLALAFQLILESARHLSDADEIIETLAAVRDGRFSPADRALLHAWFRARQDRDRHGLSAPLALRLIEEPSLRPLVAAALARPGIREAESTYQTLESLAERAGRAPLLTGFFELFAGALFERGDIDITHFWTPPLFRRAARVLLTRHPARALEAYQKLTDHRAAAIFLEELEQTPLFEDVPFRTQVRVWHRGIQEKTPATLEWLLDRIAIQPASRRPRSSRKPEIAAPSSSAGRRRSGPKAPPP